MKFKMELGSNWGVYLVDGGIPILSPRTFTLLAWTATRRDHNLEHNDPPLVKIGRGEYEFGGSPKL